MLFCVAKNVLDGAISCASESEVSAAAAVVEVIMIYAAADAGKRLRGSRSAAAQDVTSGGQRAAAADRLGVISLSGPLTNIHTRSLAPATRRPSNSRSLHAAHGLLA